VNRTTRLLSVAVLAAVALVAPAQSALAAPADPSAAVSEAAPSGAAAAPKTFSPVKTRIFNCPKAGKKVKNIAQLRSAVASAKPGTVIRLASGIYKGGIKVTASGTAAKPIWICGPSSAVLDNSNVRSGVGVTIKGARHVNVSGFTIQSFRKGVVLDGASRSSASDLVVRNIGEEAIKLRYGTTDSMIVKNTVQNTGRVVAMYGEGIYIGTSPKKWCAVYGCKMDRSDRNSIVANRISGTTADPIETKPGTTGGVIRHNSVDGNSLVSVETLMSIKGNDYVVTDNVAVNGKSTVGVYAGFTETKGFGVGNVFARNRVSVPSGATALFVGPNNVVDCSNKAVVKGSHLTNRGCKN
jgi:hypothetical protein